MRRDVKRCVFILAVMLVVFGLLTGCGKSVEKQIAEQLELGNKYLTESDYEQAIVAFNKVIELDPKQVIAYEKLADSYIGLDKKEEALDILCQGVGVIIEAEAGAEGQALKERAVTLCEELLQTYLEANVDERSKCLEQLKQLDVSKAEQYEREMQQKQEKERLLAKYEDFLKNARIGLNGDEWRTFTVERFPWNSELSHELYKAGLEDIVYDYGDGTYLQVTKDDYVYYGNMKDGKRSGDNGIWLHVSGNGHRYRFKGTWEDGYPNGPGEEREIASDNSEWVKSGSWSKGLENGKMRIEHIDDFRGSRIFYYSVSHGMPEVIERINDGNSHCVLAYIDDEKKEAFGYRDESDFPIGIPYLGLKLGEGHWWFSLRLYEE